MGHYPMAFLTEKQIIMKAKLVITWIGEAAKDRPEGFKFLGTKKLRQRAVILVLSKEEDTTWVKQERKNAKLQVALWLECIVLQALNVSNTNNLCTTDI